MEMELSNSLRLTLAERRERGLWVPPQKPEEAYQVPKEKLAEWNRKAKEENRPYGWGLYMAAELDKVETGKERWLRQKEADLHSHTWDTGPCSARQAGLTRGGRDAHNVFGHILTGNSSKSEQKLKLDEHEQKRKMEEVESAYYKKNSISTILTKKKI
ncbi:unnamed protein product [Amoebophrya sp. A25]|nr:unnamed protein product [Amoebophrya sp. A25]|eukprot:GSA25T00011054001.1